MEQNKILEGKLSKNIMLFFLPIWFGTFFQQLYNTADALIVGNFVGKEALAAVGGPTGTIINLLVGFFVGLSAGAGVIIAQYFGSRNYEKTSKAIHTAIALAIVGGIALMLIGIPLSPIFLRLMDTPPEILDHATTYIRIYFCGSIFNLVYNIGSGILRAMGDSKKPLQFLIVCSIVNIVLDVVFVLFLGMGVMGVGIATVIAQIISAALVIITLMGMPYEKKLYLNKISINLPMCKEIFKIGVPAGLQSVMYSLSNLIIQSKVNGFGTDTIAAWTTYGKIDAIFWMTLSSFGIAATTFVGQNFGAKNFTRMRDCIKVSTILSSISTVVLSVVLYTGAGFFCQLFNKDPVVVEIGVQIMHAMVPFYIFFVGVEILSGSLRGVGDTLIPTIITVVGICVLRVSWVFLIVPYYPSLDTLLLSYPITWGITSFSFIAYYMFGGWFNRAKTRLEKRL